MPRLPCFPTVLGYASLGSSRAATRAGPFGRPAGFGATLLGSKFIPLSATGAGEIDDPASVAECRSVNSLSVGSSALASMAVASAGGMLQRRARALD